LSAGHPEVERRGFEQHDPFARNELGPKTFTRPQGYVDQRSEIRRIREEQALRGLDRRRVPAQPPPNSSRRPYPGSVRE